MKTNIVIFLKLLLVVFITSHANAQQVTALHSETGQTMYYGAGSFVQAYNDAANGDTLYLSGGSFTPPPLVDKGLLIFGAGYHPEFTTATLPTQISSNFSIGVNASNLYVEGVLFAHAILANNLNGLNGVAFRRCRIVGVIQVQGSGSNSGFGFTECLLGGNIDITALSGSSFSNNFISGRISSGSGNLFSNNVFFYTSTPSVFDRIFNVVQNCVITNNIFAATSVYHITTASSVGNIIENNVFTSGVIDFGTSPILNNNYFNLSMDEVFVNFTGASFSFEADYQLQQPDVLPGNDDTQVGVYGGLFPLKEGGIPMNPHISSKNISGTTNASGQLEVEITVEAQEE